MTTTVHTHPLISIRSDATVQEAARLMADCSIGALGVLGSDKQFIGIITERDLSWFVAQARDAVSTRVAEIVNDFPVVVDGPIDDADAVERMRNGRIRHLIVREGDAFRIASVRDYLPLLAAEQTSLTARDVMTSPAIVCRDDADFEEIAQVFADSDVSGIPVVDDDGHLLGVISERDLAHALGGPLVRLAVRRHNHGPFMRPLNDMSRGIRLAKDVMTTPPVVVAPDDPLKRVARALRANQINRAPVVDEGRLIGVVTLGDVLGALAHLDRTGILTRPPVLVGRVIAAPSRHRMTLETTH